MKKLLSLLTVFSFLMYAGAALAADLAWPARDKLFVGFSQADLKSTWRTVESDDMTAEADKRGYKFAITNAEGDTGKQLSDVEFLIAQGANVLVIVPIDADAIMPALQQAKEGDSSDLEGARRKRKAGRRLRDRHHVRLRLGGKSGWQMDCCSCQGKGARQGPRDPNPGRYRRH